MEKYVVLDGFLIDCHCPSESNLEVEIDCSALTAEKYHDLIIELEDHLTIMDEEWSVKSSLVKGRSLRARYSRVSKDDRRRVMRFSPLPSKFQNILTNTRTHVYSMINMNCLVLEKVGVRKVYLLPKALAPSFVDAIDSLNTEILDPMREEIEDFMKTGDYFAVEAILHKYGVDPSVVRSASFYLGKFTVNVMPVNFKYNVSEDDFYKALKDRESIRGLEILRKQVEQKHREYTVNAVKDILTRLTALSLEYDNLRKNADIEQRPMKIGARYKRKWESLTSLCTSLGLDDLVSDFLNPLLEIMKSKNRITLMLEKFGTLSLEEVSKKYVDAIK